MAEQQRIARRRLPDEGNRVTTTLVYRAVDDLYLLTATRFDSVDRRLDKLDAIPERVVRLEDRVSVLEEAGGERNESGQWFKRLLAGAAVSAVLSAPGWVALFINAT